MASVDNLTKSARINLREVILGRPTRLRYVVRFSICPRTHDESVAEHSFYTAFIALMLARGLHYEYDSGQGLGRPLDLGLILSRALMHDMDESYSGDFIRMFKHSSPELKNAIDSACESFMTKLACELTHDEGPDILQMWSEAKEDDFEGAIVSLADFLSVVSYVVQEIQSGNHNMYEHLEDLKRFYETFHSKRYAFLEEYIKECGEILFGLEVRRIQLK